MDKKYSELTYIELIKEYKLVVENTDILKKDIILEMAKRKETEGIPKPQIVKIIISDLENFANDDYIRKVLKDYTDKRFNPNRNKKKELVLTTGETEQPKEIIDLTVSPPQSFEEFKKENVLLAKSIYPMDKNPANDSITQEDKETWDKLESDIPIISDNEITEKNKEYNYLIEENEELKKENRELKAENEKLKTRIMELEKPKVVSYQSPMFSSKTHDGYLQNKYKLKK